MAKIFNQTFTRSQLTKYIGDISQIADAREGRLVGGKGDEVRTVDVKTGSGLEFTILPSRGMDISWANYRGKPISFISKAGVVKPEMFEKDGLSFLRSFTCGLLTTCGLTYMGAPCVDNGEALGLHGRISNIPAQDVSVKKEWDRDEFIIKIRGKVCESSMFGENIVLERNLTTALGSKKISIFDTIENIGFDSQPFMILYHINFGFPVVSETSRLYQYPDSVVTPRDDEAKKGIDRYDCFESPTHGYKEQLFFHQYKPSEKNNAYACIFNEKMQYGAYVKFDQKDFSHFGEWKMMGEGDYVVGLDPSNWFPLGRAKAREMNQLEFIEPGEKRTFHFEIGVVESKEEIQSI